ncbi:MAG: gluconokinase [Thermoanaerobaculia bacterium]
MSKARQVVIMGVMGSGKTTIGRALADRIGSPFIDADDLHTEANIAKLSAGVPLSAEDRSPWIDRVGELIRDLDRRQVTAVIACSALTQTIRARLASASPGVMFVHLRADAAAIGARLESRKGHFADPSLLASQYATLEVPADAISVDASGTPDEIVDAIAAAL